MYPCCSPRRAAIVAALLVAVLPAAPLGPPAAAAGVGSAERGSKAFSAQPIFTFDTQWRVEHIETADLNGDGIPDIIAGEQNTDYYGDRTTSSPSTAPPAIPSGGIRFRMRCAR